MHFVSFLYALGVVLEIVVVRWMHEGVCARYSAGLDGSVAGADGRERLAGLGGSH